MFIMHGVDPGVAMCNKRSASRPRGGRCMHLRETASNRQLHRFCPVGSQRSDKEPGRPRSREGQLQVLEIAESDLRELCCATAGAEEKDAVARVCEWFASKRTHAEEHSSINGGADELTDFEKLIRQLITEGDVRHMYKVLASLEHIDRTVVPVDASHDEPEQEQLAQVLDRRERLASLFEAFSRTHGGVVNLAELQEGLAAMGIDGLDEIDVQDIGTALGLVDASETVMGPPRLGLDEFVAVLEECERKGWGGATHWGGGRSEATSKEEGVDGVEGWEDVRFLRGVSHHDQAHPLA